MKVLRRAALVAALSLVWSATGCGSAMQAGVVSSVQGVVTLNGEVLTEGTVNFASSSSGNGAIATVSDGKFTVTGGMVPGLYKVVVTPPTPTPDSPVTAESKIPEKYRNQETSDLTSTIIGGRNDVKLDLKS